MRRRRVFALLLALSLVVSGNGMTVLAAEQGADMPVSASREESEETVPGQKEDTSGGTEDTSVEDVPETDHTSEETQTPAEGDSSDGEDKTQEGEDQESPGESDPSVPQEDDGEQSDDQMTGEEDEDGNLDETPGEPVEEIPEEEPVEEPEGKEPVEVEIKPQAYVSRMVTFTDDTGMRVTYDANASEKYIYKVENGVLTGVTQMDTETVSGNTIEVEIPVNFEGNVELKQPEEGEKYTSIASGVFSGNQNVTYVRLPAGLTAIAEESFKGCTGLKGVYIPSTVTEIGASAFETCTAMTQISVPKAVTSIGDSAFKGDVRLYMVYMKDTDYSSLEQIGAHAFEGCTALEAFCGDTQFLLPTSLKGIGEYAFYECRKIKKVNLDNAALETMGAYAFAGCIGLTDAVMSRTLPVIPQYAFEGCTALVSLTFESKAGQWVTVDGHAFEGCYSLTSLTLPGTIKEVASFAFAGCTNLCRVEVKNDNLTIGTTRAFPAGETRSELQFIGRPGSTIYQYCRGKDKVSFIEDTNEAEKKYYKYTVKDKDGVEHADGKIPGGQIWIGPTDKSKYEDNINKMKDGDGKEAGVQPSNTVKYRVYFTPNDGYHLVANSLRVNGTVLRADEKGIYYVTMPVGGIILTAEFSQDASEKINGLENDVTVEYSNGEPIDKGVEIKVGQTTRIFLIDKTGEPVGASKILEITTSNKEVATVSKSGVVTAAGPGEALIKIQLRGGDGNSFWVQSRIRVVEADVDVLKLKATAYDPDFRITGDPDGIQTAAIDKNIVRDETLTITLKANAYTADREGIAKEFTWKSSDTKMVKLQRSTTKGNDATNVLEIQKGCVGEATITVTARNKVSSEGNQKETVTQKFVVSVQSLSGRLASSAITVNPNIKEGALLEVLLAYGNTAGVDPSKTKLYKEEGSDRYIESLDFILEQAGESEGKAYQYRVKPTGGTKEGTYKLFVSLNGFMPNKDNLIPLTVTVKKSVPTPTIKFNAGKAKFNLFYKNGGLNQDGDPVTVTTQITKLGAAKISKVELEALSGTDDDRKFCENFEIKSSGVVNGIYTTVIGRKEGNLRYTAAGKPAVTGNLVIYYEGYEDSAAKKMKVTMPTCTTAPSYALRETKATYREGHRMEEEIFVLYDKKSKTKEQVRLVEGVDTVTEEEGEITTIGAPKIRPDGTIALGFYAEKGKLKLTLTNKDWDVDKDGSPRTLVFTYTVNASTATPTVKTDQSAVSLNLNYPEKAASFRLVPNQRGVALAANQKFYPASNNADIGNLEVTYENGEGSVKIKEGRTVKKGTYKFVCDPPFSTDYPDLKKVTLTVKVVDNKPTVKFGKGSLQLNTQVFRDNSASGNSLEDPERPLYQEVASIPFTVTGRPEGYAIADVGTGSQATEIKTQYGSADKRFAFRISEGSSEEKTSDMLEVFLQDSAPPAGTYKFTMTQRYVREGMTTVSAKPVNFSVKVSSSSVDLTVSAKGKINLVNRIGEADEKNGILYTPKLKNINGEITDVMILEGGTNGLEMSSRFEAKLIEEGKNKGKIYVTPKVIRQTDPESGAVTEQYAELKNNTNYPVRIWVKIKGYAGTSDTKNGVITKNTVKIKTSQMLPKVTTDKSTLDVYLTTKQYDASFTVRAKEGTAGVIEDICFGEKDDIARDSFEMIRQPQADGSVKVIIHLKEAVSFANGSVNNVKMYVKYKGQGTNTPEEATSFTMKIRVN